MNYNLNGGASNNPSTGALPSEKRKSAPRLDIKDFLTMMLMNWIWFVILGGIAGASAYMYLRYLQPVYERITDIEIKPQQKGSDVSLAQYMGVGPETRDINNEIYILRSLKIAREVAERARLDVNYYRQGTFLKTYLTEDRPFEVRFFEKYHGNTELRITPTSAQTFSINRAVVDGVEVHIPEDQPPYFFGSPLLLPGVDEEIQVDVEDDQYKYLMSSLNSPVEVVRISPDEAARDCQSRIVAEKMAVTVVRLTYQGYSVGECDTVLRALVAVYNEHAANSKNEVTRQSVIFVDQRIEETAHDLSEAEKKLQSSGVSLDVEAPKAASTVEAGREAAQDAYASIQGKLSMALSLQNSVSKAVARKDYIPVLAGLDQTGVMAAVTEYNKLVQQRNRLVANSSASNPAVLRLDQELDMIAMTVTTGIDGFINAQQVSSHAAANKVARLSSGKNAKLGYDSTSLQTKSLAIMHEYKQEYFSYLLKRREELRLQLAVTESDTRVIEDPMGSTSPIFPVPKMVYAKFIGAGLALPAIIMLIVAFLTTTIRGRKDVESALSMPFLGELPEYNTDDKAVKNVLSHRHQLKERFLNLIDSKRADRPRHRDFNKVVIGQSTKDILSEAFHIVQSNLSFMRCEDNGKRPQVIMMTSFAPGAGKSFVSVNLASSLATGPDRKVLWIDMDIRKGHTNHTLIKPEDHVRPRGISSYLAGKATLEQCIHQNCDNPNLDVMLAGAVPPNPVQLLMSDKLDSMIEELRSRYSYIILDTVPATVVADAYICNRLADLTVYVLRVGHTDRNQLPEIDRLYQQHKFKNMCYLLNGSLTSRRRFAYGYGHGTDYTYGYGYGYGYGYSRESELEENV